MLWLRGHTLVLGDLHAPFWHQGAIDRAVEMAEAARHVIQVGDAYDQYAYGKYPKRLRMLPEAERDKGREMLETLWWRIRKAAPRSKRWQLRGNHDVRAESRIKETLPEIASWLDIDKWWQFEGVETVMDNREEVEIDGVLFTHGHLSRLGDHALFNRQSTVCGHSHRGGVAYYRHRGSVFWELNAGFLGDETQHVFGYTPKKTTGWTLGVGVIDSHGPRFVPFEMAAKKAA